MISDILADYSYNEVAMSGLATSFFHYQDFFDLLTYTPLIELYASSIIMSLILLFFSLPIILVMKILDIFLFKRS